MSNREFLTSLWRHFSYNVVCFWATFPLLTSTSLFCLFCFIQNKKNIKVSLCPHSEIFKTKVSSKLAQQSTDYCDTFTQSRKVKQYQLTCQKNITSSYWVIPRFQRWAWKHHTVWCFHIQRGIFNLLACRYWPAQSQQ